MDKWTNGQMDKWTNGPMDRWTNGQMDGGADIHISGHWYTVNTFIY